ncbi:MAG: PEP-CTERM sorting domain-containing protein [Steroidobacteraceae bacterium]|jgi:hypothetical protein|nr:PEP-CTERM sorting domain-containing protein [Steroidobacteraceae bacterium]
MRVVALALTGLSSHASAAVVFWDGEFNADWTLGTNWSLNAAPGAADTAVILSAGFVNQPVVDRNVTVARTDVVSGTLRVAAELTSPVDVSQRLGNLVVDALGGITGDVNFGDIFAADGGIATNNGTITGNVTMWGGTFNNAGVITGNTTINGGTFNLLDGSNLRNSSSLSVFSGALRLGTPETIGSLSLASDSELIAERLLSVQGIASLGGTLRFDATGLALGGDFIEAEILRAGSIVSGFSALDISGLSGYTVSSRIAQGDRSASYLLGFSRATQVPEPSSLVLMLPLLGLLTAVSRRRAIR